MVLARVNGSDVRNLEGVLATMADVTEVVLSFHPHTKQTVSHAEDCPEAHREEDVGGGVGTAPCDGC